MRARKRQFLAVVVTPAALLSVLNRPERAAGNLQQAIQLYQRAARESSGDRALAAEALMSAARAYEKLGQTEASRSMYAEIVRVYPEQREQVSTANQRLGETGIVQGAVSRSGNREPISGAKITLSKVTLSGGPVDPEAFNQLQNFFKARGLEVSLPANGVADEKFFQRLADPGGRSLTDANLRLA